MTDLEKNDFMNALVEANLITIKFRLIASYTDVVVPTNYYVVLCERNDPVFCPPGYIIRSRMIAGIMCIILFSDI